MRFRPQVTYISKGIRVGHLRSLIMAGAVSASLLCLGGASIGDYVQLPSVNSPIESNEEYIMHPTYSREDNKQFVMQALVQTREAQSYQFSVVQQTMFENTNKDVITVHIDGIHSKPQDGVYMKQTSGGQTSEVLRLGDATYVKNETGNWVLLAPLQPRTAISPTSLTAAIEMVPAIPGWSDLDINMYEFHFREQETANDITLSHIRGHAKAEGGLMRDSRIDVWIDTSSGYLYKFDIKETLDTEMQLTPLAVNVSGQADTPVPPWEPISQYITSVVLTNINDPSISLPIP